MSASTPGHSADSCEPEAGWHVKWIALSLLAHALLLGWLFSLKTPPLEPPAAHQENASPDATKNEAPPQDKTANISPERVQEVAQQINKTQADEVKDKVQELLATEQELSDISKDKQQEFSALAQELEKDAPKKASDAINDVTQAQEAARQAEIEANRAAGDFEQAAQTLKNAATPDDQVKVQQQLSEKTQALKTAQEKAKSAQETATQAQAIAVQQLAFEAGANFEAAKKTQADATAAQEEANTRQDEASTDVHDLPGLKHSAEHLQESAAAAQTALSSAATRLESQQKGLEAAKAKLQQQAGQPANQASATTAKLKDRISKDEAALQTAQQRLDAATLKAQQSTVDAAAAKTKLEEAPAKARAAQEVAMTAQQKATELQTKATTAVTSAFQSGNAVASGSNSTEAQPSTSTPPPDLDSQNFAQLYQTAVEAEKNIAENYKSIRAADSATLRQIPISEAAKSIQVAVPVRPLLDPSIASNNVQSAEALKSRNAAMEKALQEMDSMVSVSRSMAFQAKGGGQPEVNVSVEGMKAEAQQAGELAQLATENQPGQTVADLTELMKQIEAGNGAGQAGGPLPSVESEAGGGPPSGAGATGAGQAAPGAASGQASQASGMPGAGSGASSGNGWALPGQKGPPPIENVKDSLPGRKVHGAGQGPGAKWMFVDSWYVIGPFPNPSRRNIDTKFPPDSVIDLDASYPGKDGKVVHWQFKQSSMAAIHPPDEQPYAIYYAYTTLWFDEPRDMWIAVGSDDFSKIWINDILVWASGMYQKPWKADEGFRKVHFKQGLNRILDRVENGQAGCLYSLMLNMNEK